MATANVLFCVGILITLLDRVRHMTAATRRSIRYSVAGMAGAAVAMALAPAAYDLQIHWTTVALEAAFLVFLLSCQRNRSHT